MSQPNETCPTCTHKLADLCTHLKRQYSHCQRCGSLVIRTVASEDIATGGAFSVVIPHLVQSCREVEADSYALAKLAEKHSQNAVVGAVVKIRDMARRKGIWDAIYRPEDRPR